jgi:co-chaperonin GroES (HSP10)
MINYRPVSNYVVVVEPFIPDRTSSGIIKPESLTKEEKETLNKLKVVAVGKDVTTCKEGDSISLSRFAPSQVTPIEVDGEKYLVFHENSIIGVYLS